MKSVILSFCQGLSKLIFKVCGSILAETQVFWADLYKKGIFKFSYLIILTIKLDLQQIRQQGTTQTLTKHQFS